MTTFILIIVCLVGCVIGFIVGSINDGSPSTILSVQLVIEKGNYRQSFEIPVISQDGVAIKVKESDILEIANIINTKKE